MISLAITVLTMIVGPSAPDDPRPARRADITVRFQPGGEGAKSAIEVVGIDRENLNALSNVDWDGDRWSALLTVFVTTAKDRPTPIAGSFQVVGDMLRFQPKFEFDPGLRHSARFDPSKLPTKRDGSAKALEFARPAPAKGEPSFVTRIEPSGDLLPENLLKIYIHFSSPMSRGEVYERVRLIDANGQKVEGAFIEIGEELWDRSGTRIMLLFDPGRIKRGLRPREEEGPILEAGKSYTIVIDREWPDAQGMPLRESFKKTFKAGPADMAQPDPKRWKVATPNAASREPMEITFPEPLDRAMLDRALVLHDCNGTKVEGRIIIAPDSTRWRFVPDRDWISGSYELRIDPELEDLAGNSIARPFEVDEEKPVTDPKATKSVILAITISAKKP